MSDWIPFTIVAFLSGTVTALCGLWVPDWRAIVLICLVNGAYQVGRASR